MPAEALTTSDDLPTTEIIARHLRSDHRLTEAAATQIAVRCRADVPLARRRTAFACDPPPLGEDLHSGSGRIARRNPRRHAICRALGLTNAPRDSRLKRSAPRPGFDGASVYGKRNASTPLHLPTASVPTSVAETTNRTPAKLERLDALQPGALQPARSPWQPACHRRQPTRLTSANQQRHHTKVLHIVLAHQVDQVEQVGTLTFFTCDPDEEQEANWLAGCSVFPGRCWSTPSGRG